VNICSDSMGNNNALLKQLKACRERQDTSMAHSTCVASMAYFSIMQSSVYSSFFSAANYSAIMRLQCILFNATFKLACYKLLSLTKKMQI